MNWTKREETTWSLGGIEQKEKGRKLMWKKEITVEELERKSTKDKKGSLRGGLNKIENIFKKKGSSCSWRWNRIEREKEEPFS
jgi:hypothetical protein